MLGARYYLRPDRWLLLGVNYDNNHAVLIRTGFAFAF